MKRLLFAVSLFLVAGEVDSIAAGTAVVPGQQRLDALEMARELIAPRAPTWQKTTKGLPDPFFRSNQAARAAEQADSEPAMRAELTDRELLQKLALQVEPSGHFVVGGEPVLLVNGQRLRAGDSVTLNFEGRVHQVAISSIESNSFTLRLKQQELRRELK